MLAISRPAIPGQSQNLDRNPCQESSQRNRQQNCEPLPQRKTQELVAHKSLRKVSFYLMDCGLLVELRELGQSVSRNEPDPPRVTFGCADKNKIGFNVTCVQRADSLLVQ